MKRSVYLVGLLGVIGLNAQENKTIQVMQPSALTVSIQTIAPSCFTPCTGAATVVVSGGTAPYTYTVSGLSSFIGTANSNTFIVNNLCAFAYGIAVCDNAMINCGYNTFTVSSISYPNISNHNYAPAGPPNPPFLYNATVTISGGNNPYYTTWYNSMGMPIINHTVTTGTQDTAYLYPGDYYISVTDSNNVANGCSGPAMYSYSFSICDNSGMIPPGGVQILPNDTLCAGTSFTVNVYTGPWCMNGVYFSDNNACVPMSGPCMSSTVCVANQNTVFSGQWWYAGGCAPITIPSETLVVQTCTGINDLEENKILSIIPNPNDGVFELRADELVDQEIHIIDITGKIIRALQVNNNEKIQVDLLPGAYYVRIRTSDGFKTEKLLIVR